MSACECLYYGMDPFGPVLLCKGPVYRIYSHVLAFPKLCHIHKCELTKHAVYLVDRIQVLLAAWLHMLAAASALLTPVEIGFSHVYVLVCRYAAGATIQVILFGLLAIEIKRKAPTTHTVLEIINARWGRPAHLTFLVFCLMTNIIVRPPHLLAFLHQHLHCIPVARSADDCTLAFVVRINQYI